MPQTTANPRVSLTAWATAGIWAHYDFPRAELFSSYRSTAMFRLLHHGTRAVRPVFPAAGWFTRYLYWRHRWFDAWLEQAAPGLAIEIAAGLSARGLNYAADNPDCRYIDYDLPDMIKAKRKRLTRTSQPDNYRLTADDLLAPGLGADLEPPVNGPVTVITEGLIDYFDTSGKQRAWTHIAELLQRLGGGRYLFEIYPRDRHARFGRATPLFLSVIRGLTGDNLDRHLFADSHAAIDMLQRCGFHRAEVIAPTALEQPLEALPPAYRPFELIEAEV